MNDYLKNILDECVTKCKECKKINSLNSEEEFNYYKGRIVGIGRTSEKLGYLDTFYYAVKLARESPFLPEEENKNKILPLD